MTWIADLERCYYFGERPNLIAVGWLEQAYPYPRGRFDAGLFERLVEVMALSTWLAPVMCLGGHSCSLCPDNAEGQQTFVFRGRRFGMGAGNLFLPAEGALYVAPSLVIHYVRDHAYLPPEPFTEALRTCPPVGSDDYNRLWDAACPPDWRGHIYGAVEASRLKWEKAFQVPR